MEVTKKHKGQWVGKAHFEAGIGIFYGYSGDNCFHKHWAHQIVIGLERDVTFYSAENTFTSRAIWVEAGTRHSLKESKLLSIYIDPLHALARSLYSIKRDSLSSISPIEEDTYLVWIEELLKHTHLKNFVEYLKQRYWKEKSLNNNKLDQILLMIKDDIERGQNSSRAQLAGIANLSPSRFSHWFSDQTGIPLRSYKKWLRMLRGIELATQMSLTEAAVNAGFSDQAHFCRTVMDALGVNPASVKNILNPLQV